MPRRFSSHLILATRSPARRKLLSNAGLGRRLSFAVSNIDESIWQGETPRAHVRRLARAKACAIQPKRRNSIVIGVDTVVVLGRKIIGKPRDADHARRLLRQLSGRWHMVVSGLAVRDVACGIIRVRVATTRVKFMKLSREQIEWYVKTGEPFGKAGAYAIQGKGAVFIEKIQGSLTNVIGLPMELLMGLLPK